MKTLALILKILFTIIGVGFKIIFGILLFGFNLITFAAAAEELEGNFEEDF